MISHLLYQTLTQLAVTDEINKSHFTKKRDDLVEEYRTKIIYQPRKLKKKNKKRANIDYNFYCAMINFDSFNF